MQPFSIVENKGLLRLLKHLEPRYTIPSRKSFSNKTINDMYNEITEEVKLELGEAKHLYHDRYVDLCVILTKLKLLY